MLFQLWENLADSPESRCFAKRKEDEVQNPYHYMEVGETWDITPGDPDYYIIRVH